MATGMVDNPAAQTVLDLGTLALAVAAIAAAGTWVARTRIGKAARRTWGRAVTQPRDERRAHVIRALILPDLDAVRADTREIATELKREVRGVIESHTDEEMRGVEVQTQTIRAVQQTAERAVDLASEAVKLSRVNAARIEDVARTVGAVRTTPVSEG